MTTSRWRRFTAILFVPAALNLQAAVWTNVATGAASWMTGANWDTGTPPDGVGAVADLRANIPAAKTVTLDAPVRVGQLLLDDTGGGTDSAWTLAAGSGGSLTFNNGSEAAVLAGRGAAHSISAPVTLAHATQLLLDSDLTFSGAVSGGSLMKSGAGTLSVTGPSGSLAGVTNEARICGGYLVLGTQSDAVDRWPDDVGLMLAGNTRLYNRAADGQTETIGRLAVAGRAQVRLEPGTAASYVNTLHIGGGLARAPGATLDVLPVNKALGVGATASANLTLTPSPVEGDGLTNGMFGPWAVHAGSPAFLTYGSYGFAERAFTASFSGGTISAPFGVWTQTNPNDIVSVTGAADTSTAIGSVSLGANNVMWALRTSQRITESGSFTSVTVRSGGVIINGGKWYTTGSNYGSYQTCNIPYPVFGAADAPVEGVIYVHAGKWGSLSGRPVVRSLTKTGEGVLRVGWSLPAYEGGWNINGGEVWATASGDANKTVYALGNSDGFVNLNGGSRLTIGEGGNGAWTFRGGLLTCTGDNTLRFARGATGNDATRLYGDGVRVQPAEGDGNCRLFLRYLGQKYDDAGGGQCRAEIAGGLAFSGDATLDVNNDGAQYYRISGGLSNMTAQAVLRKTGSGYLDLWSASPAMQAPVYLQDGQLGVSHNNAIGTNALVITSGKTLRINAQNWQPTHPVIWLGSGNERWAAGRARLGATDSEPASYTLPEGVNLSWQTAYNPALATGFAADAPQKTVCLNGGGMDAVNGTTYDTKFNNGTLGPGIRFVLMADTRLDGVSTLLSNYSYSDFTIAGPIHDDGCGRSLIKQGSRTVVLSSAFNRYGGRTEITGGTLRLSGGPDRLPVATALRLTGGTLDLNGLSQQVDGLTGTGGAVANNNTGSATSVLTVSVTGTNAYGGLLSNATGGGLRLVVSGSGTLALTRGSGNTLSEGVVVSNGTLVVANSSGSATGTGAVRVFSAGRLAGSGRITGSVSFDPGGRLVADVTGPGEASLLRIADGGTINLEGGRLEVRLSPGYQPAADTSWTILTSDLPLTGSFDSVSSGFAVTRTEHAVTITRLSAGTMILLR